MIEFLLLYMYFDEKSNVIRKSFAYFPIVSYNANICEK